MKLTKQNIKDLQCLQAHARRDMSYDGGGTFGGDPDNVTADGDYKVNEKEIASVTRALGLITSLIINNE